MLRRTDGERKIGLELLIVKDDASTMKMHGRYLLSVKGGVRIDQGFQVLPKGRQVEVGPVGPKIHEDLLQIYVERKNDMKVLKQIIVGGRLINR